MKEPARSVSRFLCPPKRVATIHLGPTLLRGSSDLPGSCDGAGHSSSPIWPCFTWGFPCQSDYSDRGALLPHLFTLTGRQKRAGGIFSVALSVACALSTNPRPLAGMLPWEDRTFLPTSLPKLCLSQDTTRSVVRQLPDRADKLQYGTPPMLLHWSS